MKSFKNIKHTKNLIGKFPKKKSNKVMPTESLSDILSFMQRIHVYVRQINCGISAFKFLRLSNGSRVPFEEIEGFRLTNFEVIEDDGIIISHRGIFPSTKYKAFTVKQRMYLTSLAVINVYDHVTEFLSDSAIDFCYVENQHDVQKQMMQEWVYDKPGNLLARWISPKIDRDVSNIGFAAGRYIRRKAKGPIRNLNLDYTELGINS